MWYQQDGAPPHFARCVRNLLTEKFHHQWIGRGGPIEWPARSPDLTPLDFYLWGHVKSIVYRQPPNTIAGMKLSIMLAFRSIKNAPSKR